MGFPSQEYWSGLPFPPPGHLPDLGIEPVSPVEYQTYNCAEVNTLFISVFMIPGAESSTEEVLSNYQSQFE